MKFCYIDESGLTKGDRIIVLVGVVVDSHRMHISKAEWSEMLGACSRITGKPVAEIHMRDVYRGRGEWHDVDPAIRHAVIGLYIDWLLKRKHKFTFTAVDAERLQRRMNDAPELFAGCRKVTPGCVGMLHLMCSIQKQHKSLEKPKGHTVLVCDGDTQLDENILDWSCSPPAWTDTFYDKEKRQQRFDQIVDVPYYGDSKRILLLQMSDLLAYILRLNVLLRESCEDERYRGEGQKVEEWVNKALTHAYASPSRWPKRGRTEAQEFFYSIAPETLRGR